MQLGDLTARQVWYSEAFCYILVNTTDYFHTAYLVSTTILIFVLSGLNSVECYDPRNNEWKMVAPMSTRRSSVGVGVVGSKFPCLQKFFMSKK